MKSSQKSGKDPSDLDLRLLRSVSQIMEVALKELKNSAMTGIQKKWLGVLESNLKKMVLPQSHRLSTIYYKLTPTEIKIAGLIEQGDTNKEIAALLDISCRTIEAHRDNIRKKLGLKNKKINLRMHLLTLE